MLLTRDKFRESVFARDGSKCVFCEQPAKDAHHILERRLFPDGGYYLDNGASVCEWHHMKCEETAISCEEVRKCAGIKTTLLPPHLYRDQLYDKWGNPILANGMRLRGELFNDPSVQKVIHSYLSLFTNRVKYPRTYHLPWSPGGTEDDRKMTSLEAFKDKDVIVTLKMDGENTTMYQDGIHARSLDYSPHLSRDRVKALHANIATDIPYGWRICGENLYAVHSIKYEKLPSYFMMFAIWNDKNECLSWDETVEWANLLGFETVPVIARGKFSEHLLFDGKVEEQIKDHEGYVVRLASSFHYKDFRNVVGKYVRKNHVQTHGHWSHRQIQINKLRQ